MADMFAPLVAQLKANPKTIVFTEGNDPRILEAASKLLAEGVLKVVMVGNEAECKAAAAAGGFDISAAEIIDPENYAGFDEMVNTMVELRKGKQTAEECTALLKKSNYFGTMLVKMGKADCLLGGATYSTADTIRPALQLVKTKKGAHLVSSCFILDRDCGEEGLKRIAMGDCAVNIDYTDTVDKATGEVKVAASAKLAEVAVETAKTAKLFGIDPKVAVLSFSTKGSGKGGTVALSHDAVIKAQEMDPELAVDGELQFDAAVAPEVAQVKCKGSKVAGQANTFIFPCIEAGNIGYKIGGWGSAVREVVLSGCGFYETETEESLAAGNRPVWFITLGQSGITDVRMERCTIWADRCEVIFHMVGDKTHAVVDNCDITLNQPDDVAGHDIRKSANPMLAQGNGRADGSTVIQNSRIVLSGDEGRRISYRLSALKDNTLEVSLGHGIASTSEVSGNTIRGRIQHKIFIPAAPRRSSG